MSDLSRKPENRNSGVISNHPKSKQDNVYRMQILTDSMIHLTIKLIDFLQKLKSLSHFFILKTTSVIKNIHYCTRTAFSTPCIPFLIYNWIKVFEQIPFSPQVKLIGFYILFRPMQFSYESYIEHLLSSSSSKLFNRGESLYWLILSAR